MGVELSRKAVSAIAKLNFEGLSHLQRIDGIAKAIGFENNAALMATLKKNESQAEPVEVPRLRVWWIPQVPMDPFHVEVKSVDEAVRTLRMLADYDIFQYENRVKPDYSNAGGLEVFEDGEWEEWYDPKTGEDIDEYMRALEDGSYGALEP